MIGFGLRRSGFNAQALELNYTLTADLQHGIKPQSPKTPATNFSQNRTGTISANPIEFIDESLAAVVAVVRLVAGLLKYS